VRTSETAEDIVLKRKGEKRKGVKEHLKMGASEGMRELIKKL
jgi:hypothetical protein